MSGPAQETTFKNPLIEASNGTTPSTKHQAPSTDTAARIGSAVAALAPALQPKHQTPNSTTAEKFAAKLMGEIIKGIPIAEKAAKYAQNAEVGKKIMSPIISIPNNRGEIVRTINPINHPAILLAAAGYWLANKAASQITKKPAQTSSFKFDITSLETQIKQHLGTPTNDTAPSQPQQPVMLHSASFTVTRTDPLNQVWDYTVTTQKDELSKPKTFYVRISPKETGICINKLGVLTEGERLLPNGDTSTIHHKGQFLESASGISYLQKGSSSLTTKNRHGETTIQREGLFTAPNAKNTEEYGFEHLMEGSKTKTTIATQGAKTIKTTVTEHGKFAPIANLNPGDREAFISGVRNYTETITDNETNKTTLIKKYAEIISPPSTKTNNSGEAVPSTSSAAPNTAAGNTAELITLDDAQTTPPTDPFAPNADTLGVTNNPSPLSKN